MPSDNPEYIILEAKRIVESDRLSEIRLNANGGNSILVVCDPMKETEFIAQIHKHLQPEKFSTIDLNQCLTDFITENKTEIVQLYDLLQSNTHEIFKAPEGEESTDLFKMIINQIVSALEQDKVPVLINTGSLYGTGIHNILIMENSFVMKANLPLIILYPATFEPDRILFLGKQPASKYRCMIIK